MKAHSKPDPSQATDLDLASMVAAGDAGAFEVLMRRHNGALYRTARSIVRDDAEAEDIVQESYLLAYRKMANFRGDHAGQGEIACLRRVGLSALFHRSLLHFTTRVAVMVLCSVHK